MASSASEMAAVIRTPPTHATLRVRVWELERLAADVARRRSRGAPAASPLLFEQPLSVARVVGAMNSEEPFKPLALLSAYLGRPLSDAKAIHESGELRFLALRIPARHRFGLAREKAGPLAVIEIEVAHGSSNAVSSARPLEARPVASGPLESPLGALGVQVSGTTSTARSAHQPRPRSSAG